MSITVLFPETSSRQQYDESIRRLENSGPWPPDGMELHVAFAKGDTLRVLEVWESEDKANAFAERLMPLLQDMGVNVGRPEIADVVNIIKG
jgi:hypothetical protein